MASSPFRFRWRYDRAVARAYVGFSWPLLAASGASMLVGVSTIFVGQAVGGLAVAGAITVASSITQYVDRVDQVVTQTMYPAICAVRDRTELLYEAFVKSNRIALMWGAPFGIALALFAPDLVHYVLGSRWSLAIGLLQVFGAVAALNHVAFNWGAFYRALGNTRPAFTMSAISAVTCVAVVLPALAIWGLDGLAGGMTALVVISMVARLHYVRRLFPTFRFARYALRAAAPAIPPTLVVLLARALETGTRSRADALAELVLFAVGCAALTLRLERPLVREMLSYVRPAVA
jgi:O-antigen/teichoic acid export membrane protein